MEIERKWLVAGWPPALEMNAELEMAQGYISVRPTVRIRSHRTGGKTEYVLCFKGEGGLAREEVETNIDAGLFARLQALIAKPLVPKTQRRYALENGLTLEVNRVDAGQPTAFWYAEVEFPTVEAAQSWQPPAALAAFLANEVTGQPGQSMGAYWLQTRG